MTRKSNLILDKEQSDQGLFGKLIINNQIGLVKVQKINWKFPFTTLVHLALIHVATSAKTPRGQKFHSSARIYEWILERTSDSSQSARPSGRVGKSAAETSISE